LSIRLLVLSISILSVLPIAIVTFILLFIAFYFAVINLPPLVFLWLMLASLIFRHLFLFFCHFFLLCKWRYIVAFTKVFTIYQIYHTCIQPLHNSLPPFLEQFRHILFFLFTYMCTQYLPHIHPPSHYPHFLPLSPAPTPPERTCSALLFSNFV
jgi:hypothetical protein